MLAPTQEIKMKISKSISVEGRDYKNISYRIPFKYRDENWEITDAHFTHDSIFNKELDRLETEWANDPMLTILHLESETSYHVFVDDVEVHDNHYVEKDNLIDCLITKLIDEQFDHDIIFD